VTFLKFFSELHTLRQAPAFAQGYERTRQGVRRGKTLCLEVVFCRRGTTKLFLLKVNVGNKSMFKKIKGTQDFLDLSLFDFIVSSAKDHLQCYGFEQIVTPILEPTELFKRSLGVETDVVQKEMFIIDRGGDKTKESICLRPELTAPTARAFIENKIQQTPWKVFSIGPAFRHERPQKGRFRQFHQINIELIGSASVAQDARLIAMLDRLFHEKFLITNSVLQLNYLGCFEDRKTYKNLLIEFLGSVEGDLCSTCVQRKQANILRVLDCKNPDCQKLYKNAPTMIDTLCKTCAQEWETLQTQLSLLSVSFVVTPNLVRGLDYYCKTVFEFISDSLGAQSSICGGGRYDQLISQLGGKEDQPSIGVGIGIERLLLILEQNKELLPIQQKPALHLILPLTEKQQTLALLLADTLHGHDICTDVLLEGDSLKSMMRKANKRGATYCLILGEEEQENKTVTVKQMITGDSKTVKQSELVTYLR